MGVKEAITRALCSVTGLEKMEEDLVENQVGRLSKGIQQLQKRIAELKLQIVLRSPQEVREETMRSTVERIKALSLECKQLSSKSSHTYECSSEDPELRTLESQLQEENK
jgi:N-methylhydantoinase B/oxoprolinase/acetone carboxylase alpha subunit